MPTLRLFPADHASATTPLQEPFTVGIPLRRGIAAAGARFTALHSNGSYLPVQATVLNRWTDGSARWVLLDFQANVSNGATVTVTPAQETPHVLEPMGASEPERVVVRTGEAEFWLSTHAFPFERVSVGGRARLDPDRSGLILRSARGEQSVPSISTCRLELNGPLRTTVLMRGDVAVDGWRLNMTARLHFFAGHPAAKVELTLHNPRRARHQGGFWELGDRGSAFLRDVSFRVALASAGRTRAAWSAVPGDTLVTADPPFLLYQGSSGGLNWRSPTHLNREGRIPLSHRGFTVSSGGVEHAGLRATPLVRLVDDAGQAVSFECGRFWENFPKALRVESDVLSLGLFPEEFGDLHELQGGEQKTHTFWVGFEPDDAELAQRWRRAPSRAVPDSRHVEESDAIPFLTAREDDPHDRYLALVDSAIQGDDSFVMKRERIDEYGWRHFGEIYADHEAVFHRGPSPLVSHYNNQYDAIAGCAYHLLRSADPRWWPLVDDLACHVADIDIYHTDEDWAKYNHGLFWHTVHYKDAGKSTHRTYPRSGGVFGGGPAAGHLYTTGLMLHHFLTGSIASRDAVIELATFVIDSDDGSKTVFRWLDRGRTGYATASGTADYHGPGRAPGNAVNALVDAHQLTGDDRFLRKAEEIIRRSVHPFDDIESRHLWDAERRWFYTMFLQSLGKYLRHKRERGQLDETYAYARESLLAYARWMAEHERPFLDRPEILQYPTETWPAQDMRKSEVFKWAALHASGSERDRFLERSTFFFEYVVKTLMSMETRTLARPVILLLAYGWSQAAFTRGPVPSEPATAAPFDFGRPQLFVPQRVRAVRRAKGILMSGALAVVVAAAYWLLA